MYDDDEVGAPGVAGVANLRQFGPSSEVFVAYETVDRPAGNLHDTWVDWFRCTTADCSATTTELHLDPFGTTLRGDMLSLMSLGITKVGNTKFLRLVRRERVEPDCDGDMVPYDAETMGVDIENLDVVESVWGTNHTLSTFTVDAGPAGACGDRGRSYTRVDQTSKSTVSCFRNNTGGFDFIKCGYRLPGSAWSTASISNTIAGVPRVQDHVGFDFDGFDFPAVGMRSKEASDIIRMRFPSAGLSDPGFSIGGSAADYPFVGRFGNYLHVVWHEGNGPGKKIVHQVCPETSPGDCNLPSDWLATPEDVTLSANERKFPQFGADGDKEFIIYQQEDEDANTRVVLKERCAGDDWLAATAVLPAAPTNPDLHEHLGQTANAMGVDAIHNLVHLAYVEVDNVNTPDDEGDVYWSVYEYADDCP